MDEEEDERRRVAVVVPRASHHRGYLDAPSPVRQEGESEDERDGRGGEVSQTKS